MADWPNPNKVAVELARERRERGEHKKPDHCACGHHRQHHEMSARVGHGKRCRLCPCTSYSRLKRYDT